MLINNQVFWNGCTLTVWKNGNTVTARFFGSESAAESNGAKNAYLTVPEGFRPHDYVSIVALDQNGKKMIFQAGPNGNIGIYYLLDSITSPTNIYGVLTWAAYN